MNFIPAESRRAAPTHLDRPTAREWSRLTASPVRIGIALGVILLTGLIARQMAYTVSGPIRFELNQRNTFYWGDRIVRGGTDGPGPASVSGLLHSYVSVYADNEQHPAPRINTLDYVPLRLLMAGLWVNYLNHSYGPVTEWRPEFARSFAAFSMLMELAGAAAMFFLVACWMKQVEASESGSGDPPRWDRWTCATAATALVWLNPASIIDSHVWPHGQTWILPFYLLAVLAVIRKRYVAAGLLLGIGAMFKGQMFLVAPALILWPMFERRYLAALRVVAGIVAGVAAITSPWLIHGSMAWARAGFASQGIYSDVLRKGISLNLPALLSKQWHMTLHQRVIDQFFFGSHLKVELGSVLMAIYIVLLVCCAWGMARLAKAKDRRLFIAIAAPWAVMFFVLGQMDQRYLVWGACFSAGAIAVRWWAVAAHAMLTWAGGMTMVEFLLINQPDAAPRLLQALVKLNSLTWILTALAVAVLFAATVLPARKRTKAAGAADSSTGADLQQRGIRLAELAIR